MSRQDLAKRLLSRRLHGAHWMKILAEHGCRVFAGVNVHGWSVNIDGEHSGGGQTLGQAMRAAVEQMAARDRKEVRRR